MKTLKEISASNPSTYKVIDNQVRKGDIKNWDDKIEIIIDGKSKFCTRKNAYKFGLAEKA
jgi:hypothetical protein